MFRRFFTNSVRNWKQQFRPFSRTNHTGQEVFPIFESPAVNILRVALAPIGAGAGLFYAHKILFDEQNLLIRASFYAMFTGLGVMFGPFLPELIVFLAPFYVLAYVLRPEKANTDSRKRVADQERVSF